MSTVRFFLSLFVALGVVSVALGGGDAGSDLMEKTTGKRLQCLRKELIEARDHANELEEVSRSRSLADVLDGLKQEPGEELTQKKSNTGHAAKNDRSLTDDDDNDDEGGDDDDDDDVDADDIDVTDVTDGIFYIASSLADEIQATCGIDIGAIFTGYSPATLTAVNDAGTKLCAATKSLSDTLASAPGFADDLKTFADSSNFKVSDVPANIDKTFAQIDKTLATVETKVFCAQAQLIALRLQISLFGAVGFANGYMCNKVYVEFVRQSLNATRLLQASTDEADFVKNCTKNLAEDITCYEKELEAYNKILPTTKYTAASPLQMAAFTTDFLLNYGVLLMYHRVMLQLEAEIVKLCADSKDDENDVDRKTKMEEGKVESNEDTESLTDQLQKLLKKLNDVSAKKKEAQMSLSGRTGVHANDNIHGTNGGTGSTGHSQPQTENAKPAAMPSVGQKTAMRKSFYRERE